MSATHKKENITKINTHAVLYISIMRDIMT